MRLDLNDEHHPKITFTVDGDLIVGIEGDTIASALYACGKRVWRRSRAGDPRGLLCGIGICFDCLVKVDGVWNVRACQTEIHEGMHVETGIDHPGGT